MLSIDKFLTRFLAADDATKALAMEAALQALDGLKANPEVEEKYLSLTELTRVLGYKSPVTLWRMGIQAVGESWGGGRKLYRVSVAKAYLQSPAALARRAELQAQKCKKMGRGVPGGKP
jgi:hypothetical protein